MTTELLFSPQSRNRRFLSSADWTSEVVSGSGLNEFSWFRLSRTCSPPGVCSSVTQVSADLYDHVHVSSQAEMWRLQSSSHLRWKWISVFVAVDDSLITLFWWTADPETESNKVQMHTWLNTQLSTNSDISCSWKHSELLVYDLIYRRLWSSDCWGSWVL